MSDYDEPPLPYGWIREFDEGSGHPFYVDTKADPPRSIWVHPYEDEQYLSEHPEVREKVGHILNNEPAPDRKGESSASSRPRRHSFSGVTQAGSGTPQDGDPSPDSSSSTADAKKKRGFFGKMKDAAIGSKAEREAWRRQRIAMEERERQMRAEQIRRIQEMRAQNPQYGMGMGMGMGRMGQYPGSYNDPYSDPYAGPSGSYGGGYSRSRYGPPAGIPQQSRFGRGGFGGGFGGGNLAMPLLGGLAGGLLLGDILDGGMGGGMGGGFF